MIMCLAAAHVFLTHRDRFFLVDSAHEAIFVSYVSF